MASKKESTFINMVLALLIVTLVASATLGFVYEFTKEPIAQAKLNKKLNAIKEVVPEFNNNPNDEMYLLEVEGGGDPVEAYPAKMDGEVVGVAIKTYTMKGFSGLIRLMVGLKPDGTINNISVLEHKETPGLGTHMSDEDYVSQYRDKNPSSFNISVKKDGGEIDAITAATISSRAYSDAVMRAFKAFITKPEELTPVTDTTSVAQTEGGE